MKRIIFFLFIALACNACTKSNNGGGDAKLLGKWTLDEVRADPGDGSGTWRPAETTRTIRFGIDGSYTDEVRPSFNRYRLEGQQLTLYSTTTSETYILSVQELTDQSLAYYLPGFWCGGPTGEKFIRLSH